MHHEEKRSTVQQLICIHRDTKHLNIWLCLQISPGAFPLVFIIKNWCSSSSHRPAWLIINPYAFPDTFVSRSRSCSFTHDDWIYFLLPYHKDRWALKDNSHWNTCCHWGGKNRSSKHYGNDDELHPHNNLTSLSHSFFLNYYCHYILTHHIQDVL